MHVRVYWSVSNEKWKILILNLYQSCSKKLWVYKRHRGRWFLLAIYSEAYQPCQLEVRERMNYNEEDSGSYIQQMLCFTWVTWFNNEQSPQKILRYQLSQLQPPTGGGGVILLRLGLKKELLANTKYTKLILYCKSVIASAVFIISTAIRYFCDT